LNTLVESAHSLKSQPRLMLRIIDKHMLVNWKLPCLPKFMPPEQLTGPSFAILRVKPCFASFAGLRGNTGTQSGGFALAH